MKILVVDEEPHVEDLFRQKISNGGLKLAFAFSGEKVPEILAINGVPRFARVFSNTGISGLDMERIINSPCLRHRVGRSSAYGAGGCFQKASSKGRKGSFTNPINFTNLRQEIGKISSS